MIAADGDLAVLRGLATAALADAAAGLGLGDICLDPALIRPIAGRTVFGRAVVVALAARAPGADVARDDPALRLAIREAVDGGGPDQVLVIATGGDLSHANWGGKLALRARMVGLGGVVTDGAVRDVDELAASGVSVFGQATSPRAGPRHFAVIGRDRPVLCAGRMIAPGDMVIGDCDGVVVVPAAEAAAVAARARLLLAAEDKVRAALAAGVSLVEAGRLPG